MSTFGSITGSRLIRTLRKIGFEVLGVRLQRIGKKHEIVLGYHGRP